MEGWRGRERGERVEMGGWKGGRVGGRVAGRQGGREAGRQGGREAGRQGGREAGGREAGARRQGKGREEGRVGSRGERVVHFSLASLLLLLPIRDKGTFTVVAQSLSNSFVYVV